jgi:uncharacterized protein YeaO (DUF488 family)
MAPELDIGVKRAFEQPSCDDGLRVLVDRLWPRGLRKEEAAVDLWLKDVAPSTELRLWFGHDPGRWDEFRRRYETELSAKAGLLNEIRQNASGRRLTLIYAAKDKSHNQAVVLRDLLVGAAARPPQE